MKKLIVLLLVVSVSTVFSQTDSTKKRHKHELGADITGLLSQFFNLNASYTTSQRPIYFVTYRYLLKKTNIRFAMGGMYTKNAVSDFKVNGEYKVLYNTQSNFSLRIGYEFVSELSKRWQAFYGLDFRPAFSNTDNQAQYSNAGYINGYKNKSTTYGFAPLLGFRYSFNERVSLTTEASFTYYIQNVASRRTYLSQDLSLYTFQPDEKTLKTTNSGATFNQPLFLILTVKL